MPTLMWVKPLMNCPDTTPTDDGNFFGQGAASPLKGMGSVKHPRIKLPCLRGSPEEFT